MGFVLEHVERAGPCGLRHAEAVEFARSPESIARLVRAGLILPCYRHDGSRRRPPELVYHLPPKR